MAPHVSDGGSAVLPGELGLRAPLLSATEKRLEQAASEDVPADPRWNSLKTVIRFLLKGMLLLALAWWLAAWILLPTDWYRSSPSVQAFRTSLTSPALGLSGPILVLLGSPLLVLVVLGPIYLALEEGQPRKRVSGPPSLVQRLWTYPVLVRSPMGVVSAAELLAWVGLLVLLSWVLGVTLLRQFRRFPPQPGPQLVPGLLRVIGTNIGLIVILLISLLFLPVARGSVLLRLVGIPFEHAVRYHVWIGHLLMVVLCIHGGAFLTYWTLRGELWLQVTAWPAIGVANMPGVLAFLTGLAIWVTALKPVRESQFELFFNTHQLYILFILGLALHCGDFVLSIALPGLLIFTVDRLLRTIQARSTAGVKSARLLPCGTLELVIPTAPDLHYSALSFVFLWERRSSMLEWHPFSVASSPVATPGSLTLLIKPLGTWTRAIGAVSPGPCASANGKPPGCCPLGSLRLGLEGPYGHHTDFYLRSNALLLVGGGIGVVPLMAILRDLLHRYRLRQKDLPTDITLLWAVRHSAELEVIRGVSVCDICPEAARLFQLRVLPFVTQEAQPDPEGGLPLSLAPEDMSVSLDKDDDVAGLEALTGGAVEATVGTADGQGVRKGQTAEPTPLTAQPTSDSAVATAMLLLSSTFGVLFFMAIFGQLVVFPSDQGTYLTFPWWARGALVCLALLLGVGLFGGAVIVFNRLCKRWVGVKPSSTRPSPEAGATSKGVNSRLKKSLPFDPQTVVYGTRPNMAELFASVVKRLPGESIPVLVSGPASLQRAVATQCRAAGLASLKKDVTFFNYYSVSFEL